MASTKLFEGQPTLLCEAATLSIPSIFQNLVVLRVLPTGYPLSFNQFDYEELCKKLLMIEKSEFLRSIGNESKVFFSSNFNEADIVDNLKRIINDNLVSVIMSAYNAEKALRSISILNQSYRKIEILIMDDGSNDSTNQICQSYEKKSKYKNI